MKNSTDMTDVSHERHNFGEGLDISVRGQEMQTRGVDIPEELQRRIGDVLGLEKERWYMHHVFRE